jgi:hypothetical protein
MAGRNQNRVEKRRREQAKAEKHAAKAAARAARPEDSPAADEAALYERFRVLSEQRAAGLIDEDTFERERTEVFAALGLGGAEA